MTMREKQAAKRLRTALQKVRKSVGDVHTAAKKLEEAHKAASKGKAKPASRRRKTTTRRTARRHAVKRTTRRRRAPVARRRSARTTRRSARR